MRTYTILYALLFFFSVPLAASARENVDYWYIKDFKSEIAVGKDSSLTITEDITADCGNSAGKHGIFRILPTETRTEAGTFKSPIRLISITDFEGRPYEYSESKNPFDHTIS